MTVESAVVRDGSFRLKGGERLQVTVPAAVTAEPGPEPIPLDVVYEDAQSPLRYGELRDPSGIAEENRVLDDRERVHALLADRREHRAEIP